MTLAEFLTFKETVLTNCPRGEGYFCDGTPNLSVDDGVKREAIEPCPHRVAGRCSYIYDVAKEQVVNNENTANAGERV